MKATYIFSLPSLKTSNKKTLKEAKAAKKEKIVFSLCLHFSEGKLAVFPAVLDIIRDILGCPRKRSKRLASPIYLIYKWVK